MRFRPMADTPIKDFTFQIKLLLPTAMLPTLWLDVGGPDLAPGAASLKAKNNLMPKNYRHGDGDGPLKIVDSYPDFYYQKGINPKIWSRFPTYGPETLPIRTRIVKRRI